MKDKRIGMLMGGHNSEHEVSMRTGVALAKALRTRGYQVSEIDVAKDLPQQLVQQRIDVAFVALHGRWGEDGCVQGLLEAMRIPYTGSGVLASALSMDKVFSKKIFRTCGLPLVEDVIVPKAAVLDFQAKHLPFGLPAVVKPSREGSSVGVTIVREAGKLQAALAEASGFAGEVLVEQYIPGREIQVGVLEDQAIGVIEVVPAEEFYNYKAKYDSGGKTQYLFPAPLDPQLTKQALAVGLAAHQALGCAGVSRVDTILSREGKFFLLEVNAIPGMTEQSLIPKIARGIGLSFEDLAERLLQGASLKA